MQVLHGHVEVPTALKGGAIAIGNFDGVHRGHQALIREALAHARRSSRPAGVMVFEPHPREFFQPATPHFRLTPLARKLALLEKLGLDLAVVQPFDATLAAMSPTEFIERILVAGLGVGHVVIGYDFYFGRGRTGTPDTLREAGARYGFSVLVVAPVAEAGEPFSSTQIRFELAQGNVRAAAHALGTWWRVSGTVVSGAHIGTGLGFPTANIPLPLGTGLGHGIYAVRVHLGTRTLHGAAYLGTRPTFDNGQPVLEVFLLDFSGDLYGRHIEVEFIDFIRADRKFASAAELATQMASDVRHIREILATHAARLPTERLPLE
jgi:riboflavin kinase/FMN adenylyltransferase